MTANAELWGGYIESITAGLRGMRVTDDRDQDVPAAEGFARWVAMTRTMHDGDGQLFMIGNGGSAGMASHMVTDALTNGHLRAFAFNDTTLVTALANDLTYDQVFTLPLERLARAGDMLVAISGSGNSPNIVRAVETSRSLGVQVVTLSAMNANNRCRALGDLNFYVPLARYGWAQSAHQVILHYWFDQYLDRHGSGAV